MAALLPGWYAGGLEQLLDGLMYSLGAAWTAEYGSRLNMGLDFPGGSGRSLSEWIRMTDTGKKHFGHIDFFCLKF